MKQEKVVYRKGEFTDFAGIKRPYTFAAVSVESDVIAMNKTYSEFFGILQPVCNLPKGVYLGLSVVHPDDVTRTKKAKVNGVETEVPVYNEQIGEQIAKGKALNSRTGIKALFATETGFINTPVVEALLDQEEAHFLANPGKYIANYDRDHYRYNFAKLGGEDAEKIVDEAVDSLGEKMKVLGEIEAKAIEETFKK